MANLTPSFRFPASLPADAGDRRVLDALTQHANGLVDVNQAIVALSGKVDAITGVTSVTATSTTNSTTVAENGVSSFNAETGGVIYFPSMGIVNNQSGAPTYTTQTQDNGALIVLSSPSAVAVTLNFTVASPWFTTISNQGAGVVTITPSSGLINGAGSATLTAGNFSTIFFDGTNWWSDAPATGGSVGYTLGGTLAAGNVALGAGAGTGATFSVSGLDGNHIVAVTVGTTPSAAAAIYTLTYTASRGHASIPIISFGGNVYSGFSQLPFIATSSATGYTLQANTAALTAGTAYVFSLSCP